MVDDVCCIIGHMINTTFIYALKDPRTGEIRYVGKADKPKSRLQHHIKGSTPKTHKECWLFSLRQAGLRPALEVLDEIPTTQWKFWEREYIRIFRALGFRLTNLSDGGDGQEGYHHTEETKKKISEKNTGRKDSIETKKRKSEASKSRGNPHMIGNAYALGHKHSEETRKQMSLSHTGRPGPNIGRKFPNRKKAK